MPDHDPIDAAVAEGKIIPARAAHYRTLMKHIQTAQPSYWQGSRRFCRSASSAPPCCRARGRSRLRGRGVSKGMARRRRAGRKRRLAQSRSRNTTDVPVGRDCGSRSTVPAACRQCGATRVARPFRAQRLRCVARRRCSDFDWRTGSALAALGFPNEEARAAIVGEVVGSRRWMKSGRRTTPTSKQVRWLIRTAIDRRELHSDDSHSGPLFRGILATIADVEPLDLSELSDEDAAGFRAF